MPTRNYGDLGCLQCHDMLESAEAGQSSPCTEGLLRKGRDHHPLGPRRTDLIRAQVQGDGNYQTLINDALRIHIEDREELRKAVDSRSRCRMRWDGGAKITHQSSRYPPRVR